MSPHVIDDTSGNLTVEMEPILKVVLERRGNWHQGKTRVRTLGNLQSLWQSQVLQMRKRVQRVFLKAT